MLIFKNRLLGAILRADIFPVQGCDKQQTNTLKSRILNSNFPTSFLINREG